MKRLPLIVLLVAGVAALSLALRLLVPPRPAAASLPEKDREETEAAGRRQSLRTLERSRASSGAARRPPAAASPQADRETSATRPPRRELTGYLVDDFRGWSVLPPGYRAEHLRVASGGITVDTLPAAEQTRSATLLSPPLPLRPPPGGRPDTPGRELPAGSSLTLEIRLSRDGNDWSDWNLVERQTAPDGPLAALPPQPDPAGLEAYQDSTTTGPTIQYRLTLTVGSGGAPTLRDLRIWHEGPAQLERDLSLHSPVEE